MHWMLALPLLALLSATPVDVLPSGHLSLLPRSELKAHLRALDFEVRALRHEATGWQVFQASSGRATPFVLVTAVPVGLLGFISAETHARFPDDVWLVAGGALVVGILSALFYAVGTVVEHVFIVRPAHQARLRELDAYRPVVADALSRAPPASDAPTR